MNNNTGIVAAAQAKKTMTHAIEPSRALSANPTRGLSLATRVDINTLELVEIAKERCA